MLKLNKKDRKILDKHYPPCGECAFCGHEDKRHRLWDVFIDSKEPIDFLAHIYETTIEHIKDVKQIKPYK